MRKYAAETTVSPERSMEEIKSTLRKFGATGFATFESEDPPLAALECNLRDRRLRFFVELPQIENHMISPAGRRRTREAAMSDWEKAVRQKWRSLALVVKAKVVAVEDGIRSFEQEFALDMVMANGKTVYQNMQPALAQISTIKELPALMPGS